MVGGLDLALEGSLIMGCAGLLELLVERQHLIHQGDHAVVASNILRIGEVNDANGDFAQIVEDKLITVLYLGAVVGNHKPAKILS